MKWRIYKEANEILHDTEDWDMFVVNIGWAGPEGYDDIGDGDEAYRAWDKFIEDNDLPVCVGMKFPKGMDFDIKRLLEKQYGFPVENYDIDRSKGAMEFQTPWLEWTPVGWQEKDEVEFVSESEESSFARSSRPQIYKYYDDDETPIEEFVKKVRDAEKMVEDIFIQNSDYYENEDNPWETFCDDMCDGESPEEAFDLNYYMNQAAYDQLPEDIRKYTHLSTGTCDFDAMQWLYGVFERLMPICKDQVDESSRFGFNVGDEVELTSDVEPNRFSDRGVVPAGTVGEIVAVDKPMRGVIKVKIEDGTVVSVPERKLKFAGTENEPWEKYKTPEKPKPSLKEILDKHGPEEIYMEPPRPGSPKWTGD